MFDLATDSNIAKITLQIFEDGGVVGAVSHGQAGRKQSFFFLFSFYHFVSHLKFQIMKKNFFFYFTWTIHIFIQYLDPNL